MSQAGMARHHLREREKGWRSGLLINGTGVFMAPVVVSVILVTKFTHGAWVIVILVPLMVWGLARLNKQYESEIEELEQDAPSVSAAPTVQRHSVLVLVDALDVPAGQALQYARTLFPDRSRAIHLDLDPIRTEDLTTAWGHLGYTHFPLEIVECPDRRASCVVAEIVARELLHGDTEVSVLIPRRIYSRFWHRLCARPHRGQPRTCARRDPARNVTFVPYLMGRRGVHHARCPGR